MEPNLYPGPCDGTACGRPVAARQGFRDKRGGRWRVYCSAACATTTATVPGPSAPADLPPAEVRVTGTPAQCAAVAEALKLGMGVRVENVSEPRDRRDSTDDRVTLYIRAAIDPRHLAAIEKEAAR
ncbi:hypothetical protein ACWC9H_27190 [Streptomyces sp. NPDC001251]